MGLSDRHEVHIASLLVHSRPAGLDATEAAIKNLAGAEVHGRDPAGKLLVTVETECEADILSHLSLIQDLDDVLSAVLIYHEVDLPEATQTSSEPKPSKSVTSIGFSVMK